MATDDLKDNQRRTSLPMKHHHCKLPFWTSAIMVFKNEATEIQHNMKHKDKRSILRSTQAWYEQKCWLTPGGRQSTYSVQFPWWMPLRFGHGRSLSWHQARTLCASFHKRLQQEKGKTDASSLKNCATIYILIHKIYFFRYYFLGLGSLLKYIG